MPSSRRLVPTLLLAATVLLAGCDQLGIPNPAVEAAKREAEGKAIGAGCRHAARSVENCYETNKRADKAAIFAGWREMNDYMRENNIEAMPAPPPVAQPAEDEADTETGADKGAKAAKTAKAH